MSRQIDTISDRLKRTRYSVKVVHEQMNLIIGLHAVLHLQYVHEGHMDEHVFDQLDLKIHQMEQDLSNILGSLYIEDLPF